MAKGFTVKAKTPTKGGKKKEIEYDYEKAKELIKGKAVVLCLPGRGCSYAFMKNFVQLCFDLVQNGCEYPNLSGLLINGQLCTL